jgi:hypothetical protein
MKPFRPRILMLRLAALAGVLCPGGSLAQEAVRAAAVPEPLVTDRPDFTEAAVTVSPGKFQVELGYTFTRSGDEEQHSFGELLVRIGALEWLEARLGMNSFAVIDTPGEDLEGLQDMTLGAKLRLYRPGTRADGWEPETSLLAGLALPTGGEEVGEEDVQPAATLALAWTLSGRLSLGSNLGWIYASDGADNFHQFVGSMSLGAGLTGGLGTFIEYFGFFPAGDGGSSTHFLDGGLTLLMTPDFQVDWRVGLGLNDPDPNWFTGIGAGFRP